jgi:peptidoglycan hydrolase-like protein with peptidoglycan-binding domain
VLAAVTTGAFHGDSLPLGPGSQGSWVKWVQNRLHQLGYYHGSISGDYDQATALAVQQFQASAGVTGDPASTAGQHTLVALAAAGSTPNLRYGTRSSDVARLDEALDLAEGANLSGDKYSIQTAEAVAQYQQSVGLQPSGQVDGATWAKLQTGTLGG